LIPTLANSAWLASCLESAFTARRVMPSFAMLACDTSGDVPHYVLYVEAAASEETSAASPRLSTARLARTSITAMRAAWVN
jgi:hypothetical protein